MIDSHVHLWEQGQFSYPWLENEPNLPKSVLLTDLRGSDQAIPDFVFVQANCLPTQGIAEAKWVDSLAEHNEEIRGVVAFAPLEAANVASYLTELEAIPSVVGVRRLLQDESEDFVRSKGLRAGARLLADRGWTFDACVRWHQLVALIDLVRSVPEVTFVLDHLGKPPLADPSLFGVWRRAMAELAALPNILVKLSGLPAEMPESTMTQAFYPWLRAAADLFGAERCMVGTDWPVSRRPHLSRNRWFEIVREGVAPTADEWVAMSENTAIRTYHLTSRT